MSHFSGHFEGAKTFLREGQFRGQKSRGPLKMSREMANGNSHHFHSKFASTFAPLGGGGDISSDFSILNERAVSDRMRESVRSKLQNKLVKRWNHRQSTGKS
jgi:hypothetical protein